jgi:hypothetical protein
VPPGRGTSSSRSRRRPVLSVPATVVFMILCTRLSPISTVLTAASQHQYPGARHLLHLLVILTQLLLAPLLSGCATHEMVLSGTLRPALSSEEINSSITHFRARVQMGVLEVWARAKRSDGDYSPDFDIEIQSTAALCAALTKSDLTFKNDWYKLELQLTNEYGSQWRWKNTFGYSKVRISRETLLELRKRNVPASAFPQYWRLIAVKVGPPDYVPYEWSSADEKTNSGQDSR